MRTVVGFAVAHLLLAAPGLALLWATGLARARARDLLAALGPAYLCGVAMVAAVLQLLLVLGIAVALPATIVVTALLTAGAWAAGRRFGAARAAGPPPPPLPWRTRAERALAWLGGALLVAWFVLGARSFDQLPTQVDDARIWSVRTLGIFFHDSLQTDVFTGERYVDSHLDYPLLTALLNSTIFRFMGTADLRLVHLELWICMAAFAWTVAWALAPGRRVLSWLPVVVVLPILSPVPENIALGNVDTLVAGFLAAGALFAALWLEDGRGAHMLVGGVLLAGAASTKNEGFVGALLVLAVALAVALARREPGPWRQRLGPWLAGAGVVLFAVLPWRVWLAAHDISNSDTPGLGESLDWGYLSDRWDRLDLAFQRMLTIFGNQGVYFWIPPCFLALVVALAVRPRLRLRSLAGFWLAAAVLYLAALLWVFWTSRLEIGFHLDTAANRTAVGVAMLAVVGLAQLVSSTLRAREAAATAGAGPDRPPPAAAAGDPAPTSSAPGPTAT